MRARRDHERRELRSGMFTLACGNEVQTWHRFEKVLITSSDEGTITISVTNMRHDAANVRKTNLLLMLIELAS